MLLYATIYFPASKTRPDLSKTAFAGIVVPYSIHSALPGVADVAQDNLTVTELAVLLQMFTVATVNVVDGHV